MRSRPYLRAAVFGVHGDDRHVNDQRIGGRYAAVLLVELRHVKMHWLTVRAWQGRVAAVEHITRLRAEHRPRHGDTEIVYQNLPKKVGWERRRVLLNISPIPVVGRVLSGLQPSQILQHLLS